VEVGLELRNPTFLGFQVRGPDVEISLGGTRIGRASVPPTPVPAFGIATAVVRIETGLAQLGALLAGRIQAGASLEAVVNGDLVFEIPGVVEASLPLAGLTGDVR
jgi:hypothetical protein